MTLLADYDVLKGIAKNEIEISPFNQAHLGPASYDVTLAAAHRRFGAMADDIDVANVRSDHTILVEEETDKDGRECIALRPGDFVLCATEETVRLDGAVAARVEGRSSIGRLGILVHATAGFIDPGFCGQVTLEVCNLSPVTVTLRPGMRIAQLGFYALSRRAHQAYGTAGHYQGQLGPTESRFRLEPAKAGLLSYP